MNRRMLTEKLAELAAVTGGMGELAHLHSGACLAMTLNDRLDYFGQTVNIAARVQALADANEIVVTDDVVASAAAKQLTTDLQVESRDAQLKGVAEVVRVHRIRR